MRKWLIVIPVLLALIGCLTPEMSLAPDTISDGHDHLLLQTEMVKQWASIVELGRRVDRMEETIQALGNLPRGASR